ncbi:MULTISPECIES: T9SS C-terminal target domain-containing protein [unclassified Lentimicrobium]|uniref:T9SS C-terminal target domain-containing protein n=1 Tax=unclassified Lentimicrobium TaxID=2677434 RepID=UPI0015541870|nr:MULTISPECIES: T9SS C-terminal target domain-containing protein [unclassified Lentimicrobium]NPD46633.1 T9SS type A sorting domain-containing protein [Lentimicrobium sp. S6]NPD84757.1 T9SS type A sorting domain-containing protein [Lentimicrobium sp. L6]
MKTKLIFAALFWGLITTSSFSQAIVWNPKAELPAQIYSGSAVSCQGKVYFIGGQIDIGSTDYIVSNMIFEYDLATDEWIEKPNMPTARYNLGVAAVDGKIYAIGGDSFLDKNEMYDPTTETWQTLTPMPTARQHIKAAVVNGKIYIIGGLLVNYSQVSSKNEVYDPQTDTWEEMAPIPTPKHNYASMVYNDKIYIFGGSTQNGGNVWVQTSTVEVYDPSTNTWDTSVSLPSVRFNPGIGFLNNKIIITGGISGNETLSDVDVFDPVSNTWSEGTSLPMQIVAMGSTTLNNKIYIIGGSNGPGAWIGYNSVYEGAFDESTGTDQIANMENHFKLYPNPTKDYCEIKYDGAKIESVLIMNAQGTVVYTKKLIMLHPRINVSELNDGFYYVKIHTTDNEVYTSKLLKIQ